MIEKNLTGKGKLALPHALILLQSNIFSFKGAAAAVSLFSLFSNSEAAMLSMPVLESFNTYDNPCSWRRVRCQTFS